MTEMKTLTIGNKTYEVVDDTAREKLDSITQGEKYYVVLTINKTLVADENGNITITPDDIGAAISVHTHDVATTSAAGFMSKTDKNNLNSLLSRVNQGLLTTSRPTFASVTATGTITADKVVGAVYA